MHVEIAFTYNHGIGDEICISGQLVSSLLRIGASVNIWTFHSSIYQHPQVITHNWQDQQLTPYVAPKCDLGLCFYSREPRILPLYFDRTPLVVPICQKAGWMMFLGDGLDDGHKFSAYEYSTWILEQLGITKLVEPPWDFLPSKQLNYVLLNFFGKGDECKGVPFAIAWEVVLHLVEKFPEISFVVVNLKDEEKPEPPYKLRLKKNLHIESLLFGDAKATRIYCEAGAVITAEGGGYHMSFGAKKNTLLVTSIQWFSIVSEYTLPPINHEMVLFDSSIINPLKLSNDIASWIVSNWQELR